MRRATLVSGHSRLPFAVLVSVVQPVRGITASISSSAVKSLANVVGTTKVTLIPAFGSGRADSGHEARRAQSQRMRHGLQLTERGDRHQPSASRTLHTENLYRAMHTEIRPKSHTQARPPFT
jgi:hypothetical protein